MPYLCGNSNLLVRDSTSFRLDSSSFVRLWILSWSCRLFWRILLALSCERAKAPTQNIKIAPITIQYTIFFGVKCEHHLPFLTGDFFEWWFSVPSKSSACCLHKSEKDCAWQKREGFPFRSETRLSNRRLGFLLSSLGDLWLGQHTQELKPKIVWEACIP